MVLGIKEPSNCQQPNLRNQLSRRLSSASSRRRRVSTSRSINCAPCLWAHRNPPPKRSPPRESGGSSVRRPGSVCETPRDCGGRKPRARPNPPPSPSSPQEGLARPGGRPSPRRCGNAGPLREQRRADLRPRLRKLLGRRLKAGGHLAASRCSTGAKVNWPCAPTSRGAPGIPMFEHHHEGICGYPRCGPARTAYRRRDQARRARAGSSQRPFSRYSSNPRSAPQW